MQILPERRVTLIGALAFAVLVLAAYSQFIFSRRLDGQPWHVVVTFVLGALYAVLGIFGNDLTRERSRLVINSYYFAQCLIAAAAILLSPARGIFFLLAMPLVSESVFDFGWRGAALITGWLYAVSVASLWIPFGLESALHGAIGYFPAFLFTLLCSLIARQANLGKDRAERLSAELTTANAQLRAHAAQADELATTRERNRLAREIHDGVGHYLTVIKVQLDAAAALLPSDPQRAAASVEKAARLAGEALDDVRRSVGTLGADAERPPLMDTLRHLVADVAPSSTFRLEGTPRPLSAAAEHAFYRTAQEGLTNIRKHAAATTATLTLDFRDPAHVRLVLIDNGTGAPLAPNRTLDGSGHGLRGLRERIALLGGTVIAGNRPEGGFAVTAEVPA